MKKSEGSCILISLPEAKNPDQDAILGYLVKNKILASLLEEWIDDNTVYLLVPKASEASEGDILFFY